MSAGDLSRHFERWRSTWRTPSSFTALVPVTRGTELELRSLLARLAPRFHTALAAVDDLHSFRLVVVPSTAPGMRSLHLLLNSVHDYPLDEHLQSLMTHAGPLLNEAFAAAQDYDRHGALPDLWRQHRVRERTSHLGAAGRTLAEIRQEHALREEIGGFADRALAEGRWTGETAAETVRREIRQHILSIAADRNLPSAPTAPLSTAGRALRFLDLLLTFSFPAIGVLWTDIGNAIRRIPQRMERELTWCAYGAWWIYGAIPTGLALAGVRWLELYERQDVLPSVDDAKVERLETTEDIRLKNEVTYWFAVKDSWIRRGLLAIILWGSERGCRHFWTNGALAGIDTIHYARIMQLAGKRVMLFMSDYDGSLDRYLQDFTSVGSRAVIPIASNVTGSPTTRWLYGKEDPVTFGSRLGNVLRTYQLQTAVWYNAYPFLSVRDVWVNRAIRDGLFAAHLSEEDARGWTELL